MDKLWGGRATGREFFVSGETTHAQRHPKLLISKDMVLRGCCSSTSTLPCVSLTTETDASDLGMGETGEMEVEKAIDKLQNYDSQCYILTGSK